MRDETLKMVHEFNTLMGVKRCTGPLDPRPNFKVTTSMDIFGKHCLKMSLNLKTTLAANREMGITEDPYLVRFQLIIEELGEVALAIVQHDNAAILHELADLRYVCDGAADALGFGELLVPAVRLIHTANLSKLDDNGKPVIGPSGRVEKGPNYKKPDVSKLLKESDR